MLFHSISYLFTYTHSLTLLTHSFKLTDSLTHLYTHSLILWRLCVSASFAWQPWDNVRRQGVGQMSWHPSGGSPVSLGYRCFIAKKSDIRPGVPPVSL